MDYRGKNMRNIFLLIGTGVLVCAVSGSLCGCGSNEKSSVANQHTKGKPATAATNMIQVKESKLKGPMATPSPPADMRNRVDWGSIPVFPPGKDGKPGLTRAEVEAAIASRKPPNPALIPAFPPGKDGKPGPTQAEVEAAIGSRKLNLDPSVIPAFPPGKDGKPGPTQAEVEAAIGSRKPVIDPSVIPAFPPGKDGKPSPTMAEVWAKTEANANGNIGPMEPVARPSR